MTVLFFLVFMSVVGYISLRFPRKDWQMRRLPLVLATLAIVMVGMASPASAQTAGKSFGLQAGFGLGYGTVPKDTTRKMEPMFNIGGVAIMPFSTNWAFQPELKYDKRKITVGGISTDVGYISLPVLVRNKFLGVYMVQGLAINTVAHASIFDVDFKKALTSPDVTILIGVGKRHDRWSIEGRWETGLRTFQKDLALSGVRMRSITAVGTVYLK